MTNTKAAVVGALNFLAPALFCVGLLAPLTPSEGIPGPAELSIFVGLPLVIILYTVAVVPLRGLRVLLLLEGATILAFTAYLLRLQVRTS